MNFDFTEDKLKKILVGNNYVSDWFKALNEILPEYEIDTELRVAMFLAQCGHESADFKVLKENLNYRAESLRKVFPKYFPTDKLAKDYAHQPEKIANRVYANRMGNGDESSGDGFKYCGRGLIQLTGKSNYESFAASIETLVEEIPTYLLTFEGAVQSACWFWETNNINPWCDKKDVLAVTKIINGGTNGLQDRIDRYNKIIRIL